MNPNKPWICKECICFLEKYIKSNDSVLEFGSGRSTSWFLSLCDSVDSIETDRNWYDNVKVKNQNAINLKNLDLSYCNDFKNLTIKSEYDLVLVDGGDRYLACVIAMKQLKRGGILVFDNVERYIKTPILNTPSDVLLRRSSNDFVKLEEELCKWRNVFFSNKITQTAIFWKP